MNVNQKGCVGLIKVVEDLYAKGYHCFLPFDDFSPVDIIALAPDGSTTRLQVKYRSRSNRFGGYYELPASSVVNGKRVPIDRSKIDGWAVYLVDDDCVVYIPVGYLDGQTCKSIRASMTWNWMEAWQSGNAAAC